MYTHSFVKNHFSVRKVTHDVSIGCFLPYMYIYTMCTYMCRHHLCLISRNRASVLKIIIKHMLCFHSAKGTELARNEHLKLCT